MKELKTIEEIGSVKRPNSNKTDFWLLCECYCGTIFKLRKYSLKTTKSCGCLQRESIKQKTITHNLSSHNLSSRWRGMKGRCYNPNNNKYINYGARGIIVCDEWKNDFKAFYDWSIKNGYSKELSLDRIDVNGNYEPSNCRWTDAKTQARNIRLERINNTVGYKGVSVKNKKFQARIGINYKDVYLGTFDNAIDGALAYDKYIIDNNLEHTRNFS